MKAAGIMSLHELVEARIVQLTRGKVISKKDIAAFPGHFPIYSSAKDNDGKFGEYGKFLFDEELITWSVDGGGRLFHRPKHKFSVTNVGGILRILDKSALDYRFLYYVLSLRHSEIRFDWVRKAHPSVIQKLYKQIPVPGLSEQKRVVAVLDEAFEGIAAVKANAEKNLQNARAIFESYLAAIFGRCDTNWDNVTLETLLERGWIEGHLDGNHGGDYPRKEEFIQEGVPYISANCLDDDRIDMSRAKYLSPARAALLRKGIAKNNDVLFAHNATVGPVAMLQTDEEKVILGTSLTYYRCNPKHILPEYLAHYMRSFGFKKQYLQVMGQTTRNQVPITKQREFFHVIPPIEQQKRIIVALDGLLENGQRLARVYERKLAALDALKTSLIHRAFGGELTASKNAGLIEAVA